MYLRFSLYEILFRLFNYTMTIYAKKKSYKILLKYFSFSYDTRGAHAGTPSHWRDEEVLEDRAVFRTHKEPAELIINPVKVKFLSKINCQKLLSCFRNCINAFYNFYLFSNCRKKMRGTFAVEWILNFHKLEIVMSIWKL